MSVDLPTNQWRDDSGLTEYSNTTASSIVDTAGVSLVDTVGVQIVDTGVLATTLAATAWAEDDDE